MFEPEAEETKEFEESGGGGKCEPGIEETNEFEEPDEQSLELRELRIIVENEEPDNPQSLPCLNFLQSFYYQLIKSFMKIVILFQLFLMCLILSKNKCFSDTPAGLCPLFIKIAIMIMPKWPYLTRGGSTHKPSKSWYTLSVEPVDWSSFLLFLSVGGV